MKVLVVDASVAIKWFVPEAGAAEAGCLLTADFMLVAPEIIGPEVANTAWKKSRRGEITEEHASRIVKDFAVSPVQLVSSAALLPDALNLALALGRTVYDSLYVALAVASDSVVVTADAKLANAVKASPVAHRVRLL